jgi:multidrug resistance efflux pump
MKPAKFFKILSIMGIVFILSGCGMMANPTSTPQAVIVTEIDEGRISALAEVIPARWVNLVFEGSAVNLDVLVEAGERVTAGQVLVNSDETALNLAIQQSEAALKRAQLALQQLKDLPTPEAEAAARAALIAAEANLDQVERSGARQINEDAARAQVDSAKTTLDALLLGASQDQLDSAQADVEVAQAALEQARDTLEAATLIAPFDGVIVEVYARDGDGFSPGQPVLLLADLTTLQVETTDLSEVDAARIQVGDAVVVSFDALPDVQVSGIVARIAEKASPGSAVNFTTVIHLDQIPEGLRWGMTAFVEIQAK